MKKIELTPDIDIFNSKPLVKKELEKLSKFFKQKKILWYIQSSFAGRLYGIKNRKITDIDIRVCYPLKKLFKQIKKDYNINAKLKPPRKYNKGEFRDNCIVIPLGKTHIDIVSDIITYNKQDDTEYNLPFDWQSHYVVWQGIRIPICSLRYLVTYKLINRRNKNERKNDTKEAAYLLKKF